jgi:hypothetical protein
LYGDRVEKTTGNFPLQNPAQKDPAKRDSTVPAKALHILLKDRRIQDLDRLFAVSFG